MAAKSKKSTTSSKNTAPKSTTAQIEQSSSSSSGVSYEKNPHKVLRAISVILIVILFILLIAFLFRGLFVAATVNGEPISRITVVRTLEKQNGTMTLENLITKKLILQEAQARNIVITQADIDAEINTISENLKKQGTTLESALEAQGMSKDELNDEVRVQLALRKLSGDVKVSDKEVADFVEANATSFPEGTTEEQMKELARTQLEQQKAAEASQNLLAELQKKAVILRNVGY